MGDANGTAPVAQTGIAAFAHARKHSPITDPIGPTVEQIIEKEENLPEGICGPVRFEGLRSGTTDEWLFVSEIKSGELPFTRIKSLRLIAHVTDRSQLGAMGMFLIPIMDKLNRTLLPTDLDLVGITKLILRIRCVLRNAQSPRRGFAS